MFDDLIGKKMKFYGVDNNCFKLGNQVFEAVEDEDDGYRSYLDSVQLLDTDRLIFFDRPLDTVQVVDQGDWFILLGKDDHVWLRFGTDYADDYYPMFVFEYTPKPG